jgi:hypothetical protein
MLMYFCRLNADDINPLLNTKLNNEGIHTWYTVAFKIFDECEMDSGEYEILDRPFNKIKQSLLCTCSCDFFSSKDNKSQIVLFLFALSVALNTEYKIK